MHDEPDSDSTTSLPSPTAPAQRLFRAGEFGRVALAFCAFFLILCAYYMLRPVRDTMAVQYGAGRLHWLFSATFFFTLAVVPLFGWVVRSTPRTYVLPLVYGFLIANLLVFCAAFATAGGMRSAAAFFIWLSVFNLFVVSLFWSAMGDCFSTEESHRLYGYITAGGTAGALVGPALTALLSGHVVHAGSVQLLAISAVLLVAAAACVLALRRRKIADGRADRHPLGGSVTAGIPLTMKLRSLRGIMLLVLCYTTVSTVLYVALVDQVGSTFSGANERTRFFATVDLAVNGLALSLQMLGTRKIVRHYGLRAALTAGPALAMAGLGVLGLFRSAISVATVQTVHRAGEYALGKPGREMIYTTVDAESRYKAKNFIDTAVYRAGDAAGAWVIAAARGAGMDAIVFVALPAALVWLAVGFRLGGRHDRHEQA